MWHSDLSNEAEVEGILKLKNGKELVDKVDY